MFKLMKKRLKNEKGLTLVELLAVIVILAIVSAIAIPAIGSIIDNSRLNAAKSEAMNAINAANIYFADNSQSTVTIKALVDGGYLEESTKLPHAADDNGRVYVDVNDNNVKRITTVAFDYGTGTGTSAKKVQFTDASIEDIEDSSLKGKGINSGETGTISGTPGTP